ncbi:MAG TPA: peptidylprolyl isomerase [Dongiaceae bacterium]|jgi:peptidyl-prolyl cis-trans isomerase SurA
MNLRRLCFLALAALVLSAPQLRAQENLGIVAIVNADPITALDLNSRMRIAIVSSRLPDTIETKQRLAPQVLRALIDDQIKKQEAATRGIQVPPRAVEERMSALAQENNMGLQQFEAMLRQNGIPPESLADQIRTELAWVAVIRRRFQSTVVITPEDIADARNRIIESRGAPEYRVSEIFLAADDSTQLGTAQEAAQRLMEELEKGASFSSVARQFSQAPTAARGGDLGWIQENDLPPDLRPALLGLEPGKVAGPLQSEGGYYILQLRDRRENAGGAASGTVDMKRILLPLEAGATPSQVADATDSARSLRQNVTSCADAADAGASIDATTRDLTGLDITALPPATQAIAISQPVGQASEPVRIESGIAVYVVCARNISNAGPTDEELRDQIMSERLELLARGYLRDLRRNAFVDIRG